MAVIRLKSLSFAYNDHEVIRDVTHQVEEGSFTAVMGPNGSGKTTLIRLVNGLLKPRSGGVEVMGRPAVSYSAREMARVMAYVPQTQYNLFPATLFDTVLLGRNPYIRWSPGAGDRRVAAEVIVRMGLEEEALTDINRLSGGQQQRVFIARALAQQPAVLLLDEPTANLDLKHQHETLSLLAELSHQGMTVVVAIHDLNLALKYCSHFMLLDNGRLVAEGGKEIFSEQLIEEVYRVRVSIITRKEQIYIIPEEPV